MDDRQKSSIALRLTGGFLVAAIGISSVLAMFAPQKTKPLYIDDTAYSTKVGEVQTFGLRDDTRVSLGTNSRIAIHYSPTERRIELLRGEAVIVPGHDDPRKMSISALSYLITDKGTKLSVRINDDHTLTVLVTEGEVLLEPLMEPRKPGVTLHAGDEALVNGTQIIKRQRSLDELNRRLAWTNGQLIFSGQTLETIVTEFNRYNKLQIVIKDPSISKLKVDGGFVSTDPIQFANALEDWGVTFKHNPQDGDIELVLKSPNN